MNHNKLEPFLKAVFQLATDRCGTGFEKVITELRETREKFLKSVWVDEAPTSGTDIQLIYREIDFDTIVNMSIDYLDKQEYAKFLKALGELGLRFGQLDKSREVFQKILREYSESISQQFLGSVHQKLGDASLYQSDLDTAREHYVSAQQIHRGNDDQLHYASALNSEGIIHAEKGDTQASLTCFKDAHNIAQSLQNNELIIQTSINLANLSHLLGNYQESLMHLYATQAIVDKKDVGTLAKVNHNLGIAHKALHHSEKSMKHFDDAITLAEGANDYYLRSLSFLEKSEVLTTSGKVKEGTALVTSAFQAFSEYGDRLGMADAYKVFGTISCRRESEKMALAFFKNSLSISTELDNLLGVGETHSALGNCYLEQGNKAMAIDSFQAAKKSFKDMKAPARVSEMNTMLDKIR